MNPLQQKLGVRYFRQGNTRSISAPLIKKKTQKLVMSSKAERETNLLTEIRVLWHA